MSVTKISPIRTTQSATTAKKVTHRKFSRYRGLTLEMSAKILSNALIIAVAIAALNKLIPNYQTQTARLDELEQEVARTQARVDRLSNEFTRNFDPYQSELIMQKHTHQIKPNQRRVVWLEPKTNPE